MSDIIKWFNTKTNRRYWYRVKFIYKNKQGVVVWDVTSNRGLTKRKYITNHKLLAKSMNISELAKQHNLPLCNGTLDVEPICYLGYFKL